MLAMCGVFGRGHRSAPLPYFGDIRLLHPSRQVVPPPYAPPPHAFITQVPLDAVSLQRTNYRRLWGWWWYWLGDGWAVWYQGRWQRWPPR